MRKVLGGMRGRGTSGSLERRVRVLGDERPPLLWSSQPCQSSRAESGPTDLLLLGGMWGHPGKHQCPLRSHQARLCQLGQVLLFPEHRASVSSSVKWYSTLFLEQHPTQIYPLLFSAYCEHRSDSRVLSLPSGWRGQWEVLAGVSTRRERLGTSPQMLPSCFGP